MATLADTGQRLKSSRPLRAPSLVLMSDESRLRDPCRALLALPPGSTFIFRDYDVPNRHILAHRLRTLARRQGILFLVAGDARLACAIHADGLHLPEGMIRHGPRRWRLWRRAGWLITGAAHSAAAVHAARHGGCDAVLLSPVFPTQSHPAARTLGVLGLARLCMEAKGMAVYALGGMTAQRQRRVSGLAVVGRAGISAIST